MVIWVTAPKTVGSHTLVLNGRYSSRSIRRLQRTHDRQDSPGIAGAVFVRALSESEERFFFSFGTERRLMPTARKETAVQELRERLTGSPNLFLTDYQGLTVEDITNLRGALRKDGNSYAVVKNTLFRIAAGDVATHLDAFLAGPTGIVLCRRRPRRAGQSVAHVYRSLEETQR